MGDGAGSPPEYVLRGLRCVCCRNGSFSVEASHLRCTACGAHFATVHGIPIMIDEGRSVFSYEALLEGRGSFFDDTRLGRIRRQLRRILPGIDHNLAAKRNYGRIERGLRERRKVSRVLLLGAGIEAEGIAAIKRSAALEIVESDVYLGARPAIVLDAHQIPYANASFDCVIAQAVLEHVCDPVGCVAEIWRVLRDDGWIYAETPFMQQVHGGAYDFTRFTRSGHRALFRGFREIDSGMTSGPGSALAWAYEYLLLSIFGYTRGTRTLIKGIARMTGFWLKYLDFLAAPNPRAADAACGLYFIGQKSTHSLTDRDLISYYDACQEVAGQRAGDAPA